MKTFILLSAVPGSGKSTWAEEYRLTHKNVFIVSSDEIRKELCGYVQNFSCEEEVWQKFHNDIYKFRDSCEDATVIADATNVSNKLRLLYADIAVGFDKKVLVIFKKTKDAILQGNKERGDDRIVPEFVIDRMFDNLEEPNDEVKAAYNEIITINGRFEAPHVEKEFHYQ